METKQNSSPSVQVQYGSGSYPARNYLMIGKPNNFIKEEPRPPPTVRTVNRQPEVQSPEQRRNPASTSTSVIKHKTYSVIRGKQSDAEFNEDDLAYWREFEQFQQ